ncbi:hypothetical protein [Cytobacillus horneckiae]|uniref:hypothetical protein n=1 Tax=Cytobacillus horneckiae TaxID=549687 RepID=UPI00203B6CDB|nr:hypothetical protein [Cytobacillus horneckiae]MCM3179169.1 hypothetical protein [Cytobacillus horneckiae]
MDLLLIITILTLLLLLLSLLLIYSKVYRKTLGRLSFVLILFAMLSFPHYSIIRQESQALLSVDLNTVSTVFLITWITTAICLLIGTFFRFGVRIEDESDMYMN